MKNIIVKKFGGTSVDGIQNIKNVAEHIAYALKNGENVVVIVSAMAGTTNSLISKCLSISRLDRAELLKEYDVTISSGEIITASLLALELIEMGFRSKSLQGWQIPILTNNNFSNALIKQIDSSHIIRLLEQGIIPVITGFQGVTSDGNVTTLGKGGSDTTASLVAAAIKADRCDIYTDVDGVYTADPRVVENAVKIDNITLRHMLSLSNLGAKVLHPRAALACFRYNIDMRILSSFKKPYDKDNGTIIKDDKHITGDNTDDPIEIDRVVRGSRIKTYKQGYTITKNQNKLNDSTIMENSLVKTITANKNILKIKIDFLHKNCDITVNPIDDFERQYLCVQRLISKVNASSLRFHSYSWHNDTIGKNAQLSIISNLIDQNRYEALLLSLKSTCEINSYEFVSSLATVSIVGYGINNNELVHQAMNILNDAKIIVHSLNSGDIDITFTINDVDTDKAMKCLHNITKTENKI